MSDCLQQIKNLVSQGCNFIKKSQKENDASNSSENLSQVYDLFTKVEKESKNIEKEFLEMTKNIKKWRKKLRGWIFVNEKEWKSWDGKDFVKYISDRFGKKKLRYFFLFCSLKVSLPKINNKKFPFMVLQNIVQFNKKEFFLDHMRKIHAKNF